MGVLQRTKMRASQTGCIWVQEAPARGSLVLFAHPSSAMPAPPRATSQPLLCFFESLNPNPQRLPQLTTRIPAMRGF